MKRCKIEAREVWSSLLVCQKNCIWNAYSVEFTLTQLLGLAKQPSAAVKGEHIITFRWFFICSSAFNSYIFKGLKIGWSWTVVNKQIGTIWRSGVTGEWFVGWTANRGSHEPPTTLRLCLAMRKTWTRFVSHVQHLSSITVILSQSLNMTSTSSQLLPFQLEASLQKSHKAMDIVCISFSPSAPRNLQTLRRTYPFHRNS